jgi:hypothetical protein
MDDEVSAFFDRYLAYKKGIYISDPYDIDSTLNDATIRDIYRAEGIHLIRSDKIGSIE